MATNKGIKYLHIRCVYRWKNLVSMLCLVQESCIWTVLCMTCVRCTRKLVSTILYSF